MLVILGLLTGGILAGQSLIRASELRSVSTEYSRYITAVQSFRDKYFAIPGDMRNATAFWGKDAAACNGDTGTAATPGTCNGNGGGMIDGASGANATGEMFQFWKQLALAGLIEGTYTGLAGSGGAVHHVAGTNVPRSRMNNGGWGIHNNPNYGGDANAFAYDYGHAFMFGAPWANTWQLAQIMKPEEVWNIDTKLDDGKPGSGRIVPYFWDDCTTATSQTNLSADYALNDGAIRCALYFSKAF